MPWQASLKSVSCKATVLNGKLIRTWVDLNEVPERFATQKSSLIDVLDESGIYGREYNVKTGSISVSFYSGATSAAKTKVSSAISRLRK